MTELARLGCSEVDDLGALYVLDALGASEAAEVAAHLAHHPERHAAIAAMAGVTPFLAESVEPAAPPADLRARVMGAIAVTPQLAPRPRPAAPAAPAAVPSSAPSVLPMRSPEPMELPAPYPSGTDAPAPAWSAPASIDRARERRARRSPFGAVLAAAAVLAIVVLGGWNVLLQQQGGATQRRLDLLAGAVAAAAQPGARVATLAGTDTAAGAAGYAVFPTDGDGYLVLTSLPPAPADRTWQAWTIGSDAPTSAGLVSVGSDGLAILEGIDPLPGTQVVALTIEPAGGSAGPTTTPVVVGELGSPLAWSPGVVLALVP